MPDIVSVDGLGSGDGSIMRLALLVLLLAGSTGCTSVALERATLAHSESATDLRYKETIENLAMIAANPGLLPSYSSIYAGTTNVSDTVKGATTSVWMRIAAKPFRYATHFATQNADFTGSRMVTSNWTLDPVVAPEKLRAMRAATRWVVLGPEHVGPDARLLKRYNSPDFQVKPGYAMATGPPPLLPPEKPDFYFDVEDRLCALPPGWVHCVDHRLDIPHNACYWAGCGGKYVWVGPEGMAALSEFVLILQQIARADLGSALAPQPLIRTVETTFDPGGGERPGQGYVVSRRERVVDAGRQSAGDPAQGAAGQRRPQLRVAERDQRLREVAVSPMRLVPPTVCVPGPRSPAMCPIVPLILALASCVGCAAPQLKQYTLNQAMSVSDMRYRQVLDDLALVADNAGVLPSFALTAGARRTSPTP